MIECRGDVNKMIILADLNNFSMGIGVPQSEIDLMYFKHRIREFNRVKTNVRVWDIHMKKDI